MANPEHLSLLTRSVGDWKEWIADNPDVRPDLRGADLSKADLREANLEGANFSEADLSGADFTAATLEGAIFVRTTCSKTIFTGCRVYGLAAWDLELADAQQTNLTITPDGQSEATVDNFQLAQFMYLLLDNPSIRQVIDTRWSISLCLFLS